MIATSKIMLSTEVITIPEGKSWVLSGYGGSGSTIIGINGSPIRLDGTYLAQTVVLPSGTKLTRPSLSYIDTIFIVELDSIQVADTGYTPPPEPTEAEYPSIAITSEVLVTDSEYRTITGTITVPNGIVSIYNNRSKGIAERNLVVDFVYGEHMASFSIEVKYVPSSSDAPALSFNITDTANNAFFGFDAGTGFTTEGARLPLAVDATSNYISNPAPQDNPILVNIDGRNTIVNVNFSYHIPEGLTDITIADSYASSLSTNLVPGITGSVDLMITGFDSYSFGVNNTYSALINFTTPSTTITKLIYFKPVANL